MPKQTINIGSSANDGTGDPLRTAFDKINDNFDELYGGTAEANALANDTSPQLGGNMDVNGKKIITSRSNESIILDPAGTGTIELQSNTNVTGTITATGDIFANGNINLGNASGDQTKVVGVFEADQLQIDGTTLTSTVTNGEVTIQGNGTGGVNIANITINDNKISANRSNDDLELSASGSGVVKVNGHTINTNTLNGIHIDGGNVTIATVSSQTSKGNNSIAIGRDSGTTTQGANAIAIGPGNAVSNQGTNALAIGYGGAGHTSQGAQAIAIGGGAGRNSQGANSIAIGREAGFQNQHANTIVLSAFSDGLQLNTEQANSFYVKPIREATGGRFLQYDHASGEITQSNTITSMSNENISIQPGGSGALVLGGVSLIGTTISTGLGITGTLTTADITTTGTHTVTGTSNIDFVRIKDNAITTNNSNAPLNISANGSGVVDIKSAMTTIGQTVTGDVAITGKADVDNLRLDGNVLSSTSGSITLSPAAGTNLVLGPTSGGVVTAPELQATLGEFTTLRTDKLEIDTSNGDLTINTQGTGTIDFNTPTQTTVGSAGGGNALPGQPTGYLKVKIAGTLRVIPFYDQA